MTPPGPSPANAVRRWQAAVRYETAAILRHGEQLLVSLILPLLGLVTLGVTAEPSLGPGRRIDLATAGIIALAVISTSFTGQAIATSFERRSGALRLLGVTPLGREGLILGKLGAVACVIALQVIILGVVGLGLGWRPVLVGTLPAVLTAALGTCCFLALALLLAGTVRAEGVLAIANLAWVLMLGLGVLVPAERLPGSLADLAAWLPSAALGDGLRRALIDGQVPWTAWLVLSIWGALAATAAVRWFRWSD